MINMDKEKIVRLFLENGFQLSKSALREITSDPENIISELKKIKPRPFIITDGHIKKILNADILKPIQITQLKEFTANKRSLHVNDYVNNLLSRYEKIRSILVEQIPPKKLLSINKITPKITKFSIIGLIKEKNDNSIITEDPTGDIVLYADNIMGVELKNFLLDDIVGIECEKIKDRNYIKKIIYPDVLSSRIVTKTRDDVSIAFVSFSQSLSTPEAEKLTDYVSKIKGLSAVFFFGCINPHLLSDKLSTLKVIHIPMTPVPKIFQVDEIKVLAIPNTFFNYYFTDFSTPGIFTSILKRRELVMGNSHFLSSYTDFSLQELPDIIVSDCGNSAFLNYKGTTIISNSDWKKIFTVNLRTREVQQFFL